jgi:hypothetical protein
MYSTRDWSVPLGEGRRERGERGERGSKFLKLVPNLEREY